MDEITPEQSEAIIEAAAGGGVHVEHAAVGELLTRLHAPAAAAGDAPVLSTAGVAGRLARRTALGASAALFALAGVAAASGTVPLLDTEPSAPPAVEVRVDDAAVVADDADADADAVADVADVDGEAGGDEHTTGAQEPADETRAEVDGDDVAASPGGRPVIEGVDATDGLDDAELEVACAGVENHGHYVSMVARDKVTETEDTHGRRVSEAARSDCGRGDDDLGMVDLPEDTDDAEQTDDADDAEPADGGDATGHPDRDTRNGNGNGSGNGNGNGNGHARGHGRD